MKIAFIIFSDYENPKSKGVAKKIKGEIVALEQLGHQVTLVYRHMNSIVFISGDTRKEELIKRGVTKFRYSMCKNLIAKIKQNEFEMIYVRYPGSIDYSLYTLFKKCKPYLKKSVLEMPTYPIGHEMMNRYRSLFTVKKIWQIPYYTVAYGMHKILSRKLHNYVTCVLSYFLHERIWGMEVVNVDNGISLSEIKPISKKEDKNDKLVIIFVAAFAIWHGVDRVVKGLSDYYSKKRDTDKDIELILVGQGEALDKVLQTEEYCSVQKHIVLTGSLMGEQLDTQYEKAHIGISSIGMHRIGLSIGSTLKTKEYLAKGLPFVYAYTEKGIDDSFPYAIKIPADDSNVNFYDVVSFYESIKNTDYITNMREYAKKYDWVEQMKRFMTFVTDHDSI